MKAQIFVAAHEYIEAIDAYRDRLTMVMIGEIINAGEDEKNCIIFLDTEHPDQNKVLVMPE